MVKKRGLHSGRRDWLRRFDHGVIVQGHATALGLPHASACKACAQEKVARALAGIDRQARQPARPCLMFERAVKRSAGAGACRLAVKQINMPAPLKLDETARFRIGAECDPYSAAIRKARQEVAWLHRRRRPALS